MYVEGDASFIWLDLDTPCSKHELSDSYYNVGEARLVARVADEITSVVSDTNVLLVSGYSEQVRHCFFLILLHYWHLLSFRWTSWRLTLTRPAALPSALLTNVRATRATSLLQVLSGLLKAQAGTKGLWGSWWIQRGSILWSLVARCSLFWWVLQNISEAVLAITGTICWTRLASGKLMISICSSFEDSVFYVFSIPIFLINII